LSDLSQPPHDKQRYALLNKLTSGPRLRLLAIIFLGIWIIIYLSYHISSKSLINDKGIVTGGDFITFYLAGTIIKEKNGEKIYDPAFQKQIQDQVLAPEKINGLLYYINPPSVAVLYSAFSFLPFRVAAHLHTLLMSLFFILGMLFLKQQLKGFSANWWVAGLLGMLWMPMMHTIVGGQNAGLTFFLLSWSYVATVKNQQGIAGLSLGLLLFKPQFAVPFIGLLLLRGKWRTLAVAFLIGACHYFLGALYCGWDWPVKMLESIGNLYREQERIAGGITHISIMEVIDFSIIQPLEKVKVDGGFVKIVYYLGYGLVGSVICFLIMVWKKAVPQRDDFQLYWALATAGTLLISLHTQYYDLSLLILPVLLILDFQLLQGYSPGNFERIMLIVGFISYPMNEISNYIHFQPLFILPICVFAWSFWEIHKRQILIKG
jgi:hypothetical protein